MALRHTSPTELLLATVEPQAKRRSKLEKRTECLLSDLLFQRAYFIKAFQIPIDTPSKGHVQYLLVNIEGMKK